MKKIINNWLFLCYLREEKRFVCHCISEGSFTSAMSSHGKLFPSHNIVFVLSVPAYLCEVFCMYLQSFFADSASVSAALNSRLTASASTFVVSPVKTYLGLIPLSYSDTSRLLVFSNWSGDYYENACAFVLHSSFLEYFNAILYSARSNNSLHIFS